MMFSGNTGQWHAYAGVCKAIFRMECKMNAENGSDPVASAQRKLKLHRLEQHARNLERKLCLDDS